MESSFAAIVGRAEAAQGPARTRSWQPGLELFLRDFSRSTTLLPGARESVEALAQATLEQRLAIDNWLADHPAAAAAPVTRPLFILGMPRAGTTLLMNLLRLDPQRRVYWHWEGSRELPPAETAHLRDDPRIALRVAEVDAMLESGALPRNHHVELGDEPTECFWLLGQDFKAYPWLLQTQVPNYFEWLMHEADMVAAYSHHRRALQLMQSSAPGSWTLKFPSHALGIEAILALYPDARLVYTHRDPIKPVTSSASLCEQIILLNNSSMDHKLLGYQILELNALGAERMIRARDAHPDVPVVDIHYRTFTRDPLATVRALYAFEGMTLAREVEAEMLAAIDKHEADRHAAGEHRYRPENYGLSVEGIDRRFGDYVERFGVELEGR